MAPNMELTYDSQLPAMFASLEATAPANNKHLVNNQKFVLWGQICMMREMLLTDPAMKDLPPAILQYNLEAMAFYQYFGKGAVFPGVYPVYENIRPDNSNEYNHPSVYQVATTQIPQESPQQIATYAGADGPVDASSDPDNSPRSADADQDPETPSQAQEYLNNEDDSEHNTNDTSANTPLVVQSPAAQSAAPPKNTAQPFQLTERIISDIHSCILQYKGPHYTPQHGWDENGLPRYHLFCAAPNGYFAISGNQASHFTVLRKNLTPFRVMYQKIYTSLIIIWLECTTATQTRKLILTAYPNSTSSFPPTQTTTAANGVHLWSRFKECYKLLQNWCEDAEARGKAQWVNKFLYEEKKKFGGRVSDGGVLGGDVRLSLMEWPEEEGGAAGGVWGGL